MDNNDILKENGGKKFDVVLMNPPYAGNLHLKFLEKVSNISDKVISIQPTNWLSKSYTNKKSYNQFKEKIKNIISIEELDHNEINNLFNTVNGLESVGIYTCGEGKPINLYKYNFDENNEIEYNLYKKINIKENSNVELLRSNSKNYRYIKRTDKTAKNENSKLKENEIFIYTWHSGKNCYDAVIVPKELYEKKGSLAIKFNNENEIKNFKNSLNTKFMNWYWANYIIPGDNKIINHLFRLKDYSKPITDETFYKIFNLDKEEIKLIENFKINNE